MSNHSDKLIYVSGAIRAPSAWEMELNIRKAEEVMVELLKAGAAVHCPHTQGRFIADLIPWQDFIDIDLTILSRCDGIVMVEGWADSPGAKMERDWATEGGLPILYSCGVGGLYFDDESTKNNSGIYLKLEEWLSTIKPLSCR